MKTILFLTLSLMLLITTACNKSGANYKLDRYEYSAGEQLEISNYSNSKMWKLFDSEDVVFDTLYGKHPQYVFSLLAGDGKYSIGLYDNTIEFNKEVGVVKEFYVKTSRKKVDIKGYSDLKIAYVYVDDTNFGALNNNGEITIYIPKGIRIISLIKNSKKVRTVTVDINDTSPTSYSFF